MSNLVDKVIEGGKRTRVVDDCDRLLDQEVASKSGLSGLAVKGAFKMVKTIKPGFTRSVIDGLLNDFLWQLQPHYEAWESDGAGSFGDYLNQYPDAVANSLLRVTDERAEKTEHQAAKKMYLKLRPTAMGHVSAALPNLGRLMDRHLEAE